MLVAAQPPGSAGSAVWCLHMARWADPRRFRVLSVLISPLHHEGLLQGQRLSNFDCHARRRITGRKSKGAACACRDGFTFSVDDPEPEFGDRRLTTVADFVVVPNQVCRRAAAAAARRDDRTALTPGGRFNDVPLFFSFAALGCP